MLFTALHKICWTPSGAEDVYADALEILKGDSVLEREALFEGTPTRKQNYEQHMRNKIYFIAADVIVAFAALFTAVVWGSFGPMPKLTPYITGVLIGVSSPALLYLLFSLPKYLCPKSY